MNLKKYTIIVLLLFTWCQGFMQNGPGFFFFDDSDIQTIKESASKEWGKAIVSGFRTTIHNRRMFSLDVARQEGSYLHEYFCPLHNNQLRFDWNSPNAHYCEKCRNHRDDDPRNNRAWIAIAHSKNREYLLANMYMYIITDSKMYAENIELMLKEYATVYPDLREHNRERFVADNYSGRLFAQSLDEAVWAIDVTRVYQSVKFFLDQKDKDYIENNLLKPCVAMLLRKHDKGNWQAWHNGAIASLGVALENDSIIEVAINHPEYGYHTLLKNNVYPDGWWDEGSVIYHFYPLEAIVRTAEALRCRQINLYNEQLYAMFRSPIQLAYSDLSFPSHNDGWYGASLSAYSKMYEIVAKRFDDKQFKDLLPLLYVHKERIAAEALLNGTELSFLREELNRESVKFPDLGVVVLRDQKKTVVFKYGPHGGGHGHFDKLSISIHNGEKEILPDLGTPAYSLPVYSEWYRNTFAHNTVTVDGKSQQPTRGKLLRFRNSKSGGKAVATTNDAYPDVKMRRKVKLKGDQIDDYFSCKSKDSHTFDYVLLFNEKPVLPEGDSDTTQVEYKSIKNVQRRHLKKPILLSLDVANVEIIINNGNIYYEMITGVAPGIPASLSNEMGKHSFPVIIRTEGDETQIHVRWKLKIVSMTKL